MFLRLTMLCLAITGAALSATAQSPRDGAVLRHTQVMMEYPQVVGADYYKLYVYDRKATKLVYHTRDRSVAHLIKEGLEWGGNYSWKSEAYTAGDSLISTGALQYFTIKAPALLPNIGFNVNKYEKALVKEGLICTDYGVIIDRNGKAVLVMDSLNGSLRHMRVNQDGNMTFLDADKGFETSLNGDIIWQTKELDHNGYVIGNYHHQMHKLRNGNYLMLANKKAAKGGTPPREWGINNLIAEVDAANQVVRVWDEGSHYSDTATVTNTHINSVALDEDGKHYLISCRDINSIIKIDRETGNVVYSIGYDVSEKSPNIPHDLFYLQHSASFLEDGNILLFNNNRRDIKGVVSSIQVLSDPGKNAKNVKLVWEYPFNFPEKEENYCAKTGSVEELPNGNLLVASGSWNRNFEITRGGELVWECKTELRSDSNSAWMQPGSYSVHYVSSLYPTYFTVMDLGFDKKKKLRISNEGSDSDTYTLELITGDNTIIEKREISLESGAEETMEIKSNKAERGNAFIRVISRNNPALIKTIIY